MLVVFAALAIGVPAVVGGPEVELTGISPADGATVPGPPVEVALDFTGPVVSDDFHVTVANLRGAVVSSGAARLDGQRVVVPVGLLPAGGYRVAYHVALADGRELDGVTDFTVAGGSERWVAPAPEAAPTGAHGHGGADPLSIVLTCVALLLIGALLNLLLRRPRPR
ncbi:copper resistance protein CopC [Micromonospora sp. NBC_01699]|uniref:copper resistance CopC family protein n=1 Tax=Micromonospora sp. NBC_01699 TaxID=2975984 RepID=UPI002E2FCAB0|nr:copper resistance CopC family protein [Micromonospora sp. NBC_01699]